MPVSASQLYLTWNLCALSPSATHSLTSTCATDLGQQELMCSFVLDSPLDSVYVLDLDLDLQTGGSSLPSWWQFGVGGCREGALLASAVPAPSSACADAWHGQGTPLERPAYYVGMPRGGASQARIRIAFSVLSENAFRLEAGTMYDAARLLLRNSSTSVCSGCDEQTCIVLNSIAIGRLPDAPGGDLVVDTPGPNEANRAIWQGGSSWCGAVPVRVKSWAQLKSLYR